MDMSKMLKDLQKMQSKKLKAQNDLKAQNFDAEADAVDKDDVEALEDLIMAAVNSAVKKKDDAQQASISDITGGMKIPGLM